MDKRIECVVVGLIETNCWLYPLDDGSTGKRHCVVIDPGDEAPSIISQLTKLDWVPRYIFLTHGHFDHVLALSDLLEAFGKGVFGDETPPQTGIHRLDADYLGKDALTVHRRSFTAAGESPAFLDSVWKNLPEADTLFEEGCTAGPFKVLHLPGHTPGSVGFLDEKAGVLFSGDTLFRGNWGRTDLPGGSEEDILKSLKRLLALDGEIRVYPGHGPATSITNEAGLLTGSFSY
ncbi:MAG: MBL fold metallo-hydrolase [Treponema sp.]|jgi:glyoxylase-like metal-dependent hydrolase (beta-lactamase superfamily II)|nr:MBL fold metallo-hydrolase [Treponema sp.]